MTLICLGYIERTTYTIVNKITAAQIFHRSARLLNAIIYTPRLLTNLYTITHNVISNFLYKLYKKINLQKINKVLTNLTNFSLVSKHEETIGNKHVRNHTQNTPHSCFARFEFINKPIIVTTGFKKPWIIIYQREPRIAYQWTEAGTKDTFEIQKQPTSYFAKISYFIFQERLF